MALDDLSYYQESTTAHPGFTYGRGTRWSVGPPDTTIQFGFKDLHGKGPRSIDIIIIIIMMWSGVMSGLDSRWRKGPSSSSNWIRVLIPDHYLLDGQSTAFFPLEPASPV